MTERNKNDRTLPQPKQHWENMKKGNIYIPRHRMIKKRGEKGRQKNKNDLNLKKTRKIKKGKEIHTKTRND